MAHQTVDSIHILSTTTGSNVLIPWIFWQQIQKLMALHSVSALALRHDSLGFLLNIVQVEC